MSVKYFLHQGCVYRTSVALYNTTVSKRTGWGETTNVMMVQTCGRDNIEPECEGADGFTIFPGHDDKATKKKKKKALVVAKLKRMYASRRARRSSPMFRPPRYDDVYFEGLKEWEDKITSSQRIALTPEQKEQKKDYLLQQQKASDMIPDFERIVKEERYEIDRWAEDYAYGYSHVDVDTNDVLEYLEDKGTIKDQYELTEEEADALFEQYQEEVSKHLSLEKGRAYVIEEMENMYDEAIWRVEDGLDEEDCWRVITAKEGVDPTQLTGLGVYWSYEKDAAEAHWGGSKNQQTFRFHARIDTENISKSNTVWNNTRTSTGEEEKEVQFYSHSPIYVYDVEVQQADNTWETIPINDWRRC